jgi:PAS domain S-box-containing protein
VTVPDEWFDPNQLTRLLEPAGDDLDEARTFMRHVMADSPVAIVVAHVERDPTPRFRVDYVSPNSAALLDEPPDRFIESFGTWVQRLDAEGRAALTLRYLQLVSGESDVLDFEVDFDGLDGRTRALNVTMRYDPDTDRLFGHVFDVSGRKAAVAALEENQQLLNGVARGSPDMFVVVDLTDHVTFVNPAAHEILGYEMYSFMGRSFLALIHPEDVLGVRHTFESLGAGDDRSGVARARARHHDGRWVTLDIRARVLMGFEGEVTGVVAICRDATPQLRLEQRLREAKETAERASRAKDEFLSRMSHELRTPLNAVLGFAQLLEMAELADEEDLDSVVQIRQAGSHLLQLIDEVLDIARIEAGKLSVSLEPVSVAVAAADAVDLVVPSARARSVSIVVSDLDGVWVRADRQRLAQVLHNLVSNAVKFNHVGGEVHVSAEPVGDDGRRRILVTDTGSGIAPEQIDRLFEPFERLDAHDHNIAGTGIGLALARALAIQMQGTLRARSTTGSGTTFELSLPAGQAPALLVDLTDEPVAPTPEATSLRTLRILYIEDNGANRDLIAQVLKQRTGDELVVASQGALGLTLARTDPPDVVLLDLHLPDMSGVAVLTNLRSMPETAAVPVVVLSADATSRQISRVMSEGADRYVTKPVVLHDLLALLDRYREPIERSPAH